MYIVHKAAVSKARSG